MANTFFLKIYNVGVNLSMMFPLLPSFRNECENIFIVTVVLHSHISFYTHKAAMLCCVNGPLNQILGF